MQGVTGITTMSSLVAVTTFENIFLTTSTTSTSPMMPKDAPGKLDCVKRIDVSSVGTCSGTARVEATRSNREKKSISEETDSPPKI